MRILKTIRSFAKPVIYPLLALAGLSMFFLEGCRNDLEEKTKTHFEKVLSNKELDYFDKLNPYAKPTIDYIAPQFNFSA